MTGEEAAVWLGNRLKHTFRVRPQRHPGVVQIEVLTKQGRGEHVITLFESNPFNPGASYVEVYTGATHKDWKTVKDLEEAVNVVYDVNPDWHKDALEQLAAIFDLGDR